MVDAFSRFESLTLISVAFGLLAAAALLFVARLGLPLTSDLTGNTPRRVLVNSAVPMAAQFGNRAVDLLFAAFMLRELGVEGNGRYAIAVTVWLYAKTITDFGLGVLTTREVAREPARAGHLLGATTLLRLGVLATLTPVVVAYAVGGARWLDLSQESVAAILLLTLAIAPGCYADAANSIFNGLERMHLPAMLNVMTNLARFGFGLAALQAGTGVVGLAAVALVTTSLSAIAFHLAVGRHLKVRPQLAIGMEEARELLRLAWPLLLNGLLVNLFFRVDVLIIQASQGDHALGSYDAAYKFINMLLIIPSYFTLAIFPILSRHATEAAERLIDTFAVAAKLLLLIALPFTLATVPLAPLLVRVLGGDAFLPDSATALRVLIWFLPLSYVNGIVQYVLIAVNRQRAITLAFFIAVLFNLGANLVLVPRYGYLAAAAVTVATEVVLFVPLAITFHRFVVRFNWPSFFARPLVAALLMGAAMCVARPVGPITSAGLGTAIYVVALLVTGALGRTEAKIARSILQRSKPAMP